MSDASSTSSTFYKPVHLPSEKSLRLKRNTFFWYIRTDILLGGINQRITSLTSHTLHRWIRLIDPRSLAFELYPVSVSEGVSFLEYPKQRAGPNIPAHSTDPLPTGDYGWDITNPMRQLYTPIHTHGPSASFTEFKVRAEKPPPENYMRDLLRWTVLPSSIEQDVADRDLGQYMLTGTCFDNAEICASWIFPPGWVKAIGDLRYKNPVDIHKPSNAMLIRRDLVDAFLDNAFGVDVDDDYRIVLFRELGPDISKLLTGTNSQALIGRSRIRERFTGPDEEFLRRHFRYCLLVHLLHGNLCEDNRSEEIYDHMARLGVLSEEDLLAPLEDPRWQTELGKEIRESLLFRELYQQCQP